MKNKFVGMNNATERYKHLLQLLSETGGSLVAFSGGVDSTFLLYAAKKALGDQAVAASVVTPFVPEWEQKEACKLAQEMNVKHIIIKMPFPAELRMNPPEHCYTCKKIIFGKLLEKAKEYELKSVLDGTNIDDLSDYRPGLRALRELEILSPLMGTGLSKQDIRDLSRKFGLSTWNKPSFACLLSRMPVNTEVTDESLRLVEKAEVFLMKTGFPAVRVRHHGEVARIEIPQDRIDDFIIANKRHSINDELKKIGYRHVTLDLGGYSMGSQNRKTSER